MRVSRSGIAKLLDCDGWGAWACEPTQGPEKQHGGREAISLLRPPVGPYLRDELVDGSVRLVQQAAGDQGD